MVARYITVEFYKLTKIEWYGNVEESLNCVTRWSINRSISLARERGRRSNRFDIIEFSGQNAFFILFFAPVRNAILAREGRFPSHSQERVRLYCTPAAENLTLLRWLRLFLSTWISRFRSRTRDAKSSESKDKDQRWRDKRVYKRRKYSSFPL